MTGSVQRQQFGHLAGCVSSGVSPRAQTAREEECLKTGGSRSCVGSRGVCCAGGGGRQRECLFLRSWGGPPCWPPSAPSGGPGCFLSVAVAASQAVPPPPSGTWVLSGLTHWVAQPWSPSPSSSQPLVSLHVLLCFAKRCRSSSCRAPPRAICEPGDSKEPSAPGRGRAASLAPAPAQMEEAKDPRCIITLWRWSGLELPGRCCCRCRLPLKLRPLPAPRTKARAGGQAGGQAGGCGRGGRRDTEGEEGAGPHSHERLFPREGGSGMAAIFPLGHTLHHPLSIHPLPAHFAAASSCVKRQNPLAKGH